MSTEPKHECGDWNVNMPKVNAPFLLLHARNPHTNKGYDGAPFRHCPWCGEKLPPKGQTA